MMIQGNRFNIYFLLALSAALGWGCQSPQSKLKGEGSLLRLHIEAAADTATNLCTVVQVARPNPISFRIEQKAFVSETDVKEAKVVDQLGGFAIQIQFDRRGSWLLEEYTLGSRGRHIVIYAQFLNPSDPTHTLARWVAAPRITQHIGDGLLMFTPDLTREEADELVQGLTNVAKKLKKDSVWSY